MPAFSARRLLSASVIFLSASLALAASQSALTQLGVSEPDAQEHALSSLTSGFVPYGVAAKAFKALPPAARAQVVEGAIAWARTYVSSPAFASAYGTLREERKPSAPDSVRSVDEELKERQAEQQKDIEEARKNLTLLPPEVRTEMEGVIKQMEAMAKDPEMIKMMRTEIEMSREAEKTNYENAVKKWDVDLPADYRVLVARRLREFIDTSADVDFSAELVDRSGRKVFANAAYESKPSDWKLCFRAGKEATAAARTAAAAWLTEIGGR